MEDDAQPAWPRLEDGRTDWEAVFEDPDSGLIALVSQAKSAGALRQSTLAVIRSLHVGGDDAGDVKRFGRELWAMLPDDLPAEHLPKLKQAVGGILRDIKAERIRRDDAAAALAANAAERDRERPARAQRPTRRKDRDKWSLAQYLAAGFAVFAMIGGGVASYHYFFMAGDGPGARIKRLIAEMEQAAAGGGPERHEFGWPLTVERRAGLIGVTAVGVPADACASAAWYFVNRGNVVINDRMPTKVGPSVLARFCKEKGQAAKLLWLSEDPNSSGEPPADGASAN